MSIFNDAQINGMLTGEYPCPECGTLMEWEDEMEDILICPSCGFDIDSDHYGFESEDEYNAMFPTLEELLEREGAEDPKECE